MDKNTVIGLGLIFAIFLAWMYVAQPSEQELAQMRAEQARQDSIAAMNEESAGEPGERLEPQREGQETAREQQIVGTQDQINRRSSEVGVFQSSAEDTLYTTVSTPLYEARFSNLGAGPVKMTLKDYDTWAGTPVELIRDTTRSVYNVGFVSTENYNIETSYLLFEQVTPRDNIRLDAGETAEITYRLTLTNGQEIEYTYFLNGSNHEFSLEVDFGEALALVSGGDVDITYRGGLQYTERYNTTEVMVSSADAYAGDEHEQLLLTEPGRDEMNISGSIDWVASKTKFFTQIIDPQNPTVGAFLEGVMIGESDDPNVRSNYTTQVTVDLKRNNPVATFNLYMGPLTMDYLTAFEETTYQLIDLGYSFMRFFSEPLVRYVILPYFDLVIDFLGSYGWAIVLFGIVIKLILYPFTKKSFESMAAMRAIAPQMKELKEKYGDDPQKQQQEMMKLYKKAGANPLGGCLPNLLQMPILITLWMFFQSSILIRQESFLWANDLSAPDVILSLPFTIPFLGDHISGFVLLMAASMVVQMQLSGQTASNPQMKFLPYIMPIVLFFVFNNLASGLSLYYFVYNMVSIAQQAYINKGIDQEELQAKLEDGGKKGKKKRRSKSKK